MISKKIFRLLSLTLAVFAIWGLFVAAASADTFSVNAVVPYEAPSQVATIDSPAEAAVLQDVQQTITGTCQQQNPATVISIWRDGTALGSVECVGGSFSLAVMLQIGQNILIAKTANANGIYGPDSSSRTVIVERPIVVEPLAPDVTQPTTTESNQAATNQGGISNLTVTTEAPFDLLPTSNQVTIRVVVGGGQPPYVLHLTWGDGSTESHSLTEVGTYEFLHTYLIGRSYSVNIGLRDASGAYSEYKYAVVSGTKTPSEKNASNNSYFVIQQPEDWRLGGMAWYVWLLIILALCFALYTCWLGYRRRRDRREAEAKRRVKAAQRKKKPQTKPQTKTQKKTQKKTKKK